MVVAASNISTAAGEQRIEAAAISHQQLPTHPCPTMPKSRAISPLMAMFQVVTLLERDLRCTNTKIYILKVYHIYLYGQACSRGAAEDRTP